MTIAITSANFESEVLKSEKPVLVDFWAPWCGPCKAIAPVIEEVAEEIGPQLKVAKINIDDNPDIATRYSIMSIPTLMIVKNGAIAESRTGALGKNDLVEFVKKHL